jgi:hypothetical protein
VLKACDCIWQTKRGFSLWGLINWGGTPPRYINQGGPTHVSIAKTFFLCGGWLTPSGLLITTWIYAGSIVGYILRIHKNRQVRSNPGTPGFIQVMGHVEETHVGGFLKWGIPSEETAMWVQKSCRYAEVLRHKSSLFTTFSYVLCKTSISLILPFAFDYQTFCFFLTFSVSNFLIQPSVTIVHLPESEPLSRAPSSPYGIYKPTIFHDPTNQYGSQTAIDPSNKITADYRTISLLSRWIIAWLSVVSIYFLFMYICIWYLCIYIYIYLEFYRMYNYIYIYIEYIYNMQR